MRRLRIYCLPCFLAVTASALVQCAAFAQGPAQADSAELGAVVRWIDAHAVPFDFDAEGHGELRALKAVFQDVSLVGLGEATHGTHEFFAMKDRLVKFLIEELGFTTFALEASYPECARINEYVLGGGGDLPELLTAQGTWIWDTEEMTATIEWIRQYNQTASPSEKVRFVGVDVGPPSSATAFLTDFFHLFLPAHAERADSVLMVAEKLERAYVEHRTSLDTLTVEERENLVELGRELATIIEARRLDLLGKMTAYEYTHALMHARVVAQFIAGATAPYRPTDPMQSWRGLRERAMADNTLFLLRSRPESPMMLWAHNAHVWKSTSATSNGPTIEFMGTILGRNLADRYYALGLTFGSGSFQASGEEGRLEEFAIDSVEAGSIEAALARTTAENFFLDLRSGRDVAGVMAWLEIPRPMQLIGATYYPSRRNPYMVPTVLARDFDGLVFISTTTRAQPTPAAVRRLSGRPE